LEGRIAPDFSNALGHSAVTQLQEPAVVAEQTTAAPAINNASIAGCLR
jgi:hypothetical protein